MNTKKLFFIFTLMAVLVGPNCLANSRVVSGTIKLFRKSSLKESFRHLLFPSKRRENFVHTNPLFEKHEKIATENYFFGKIDFQEKADARNFEIIAEADDQTAETIGR